VKFPDVRGLFRRKQTDTNAVTPIRDVYAIASSWGRIVEAFAGMWQQNLAVDNTKTLLASSPVYACVQLIARDVAKLPLDLQTETHTEIWQNASNPAFSPVLRKPNRYQTPMQFVEQWIISKLLWGNTYVLKEYDARQVVRAMYVLDPARVQVKVASDGQVYYALAEDALAGVEGSILIPGEDIVHDRALTLFHPLVGVSPLYAAALTATQSRQIQTNASVFFKNMSRPSGQLTAPGKIADETAARLKADFEARFSGENVGRILVSGDGLKFEPFTMPAEQSQLVEQLQWTPIDVGRAFQVPPYKIGAGNRPSDSAAADQEYYNEVILPHVTAIEQLLTAGLFLPSGWRVNFDEDGLVRMDRKKRMESNQIGVRGGFLSPNEARKWDNLPPVDGGETPYMQHQDYPLAALADREVPPAAAPAAAPAAEPTEDDDEEAMQEARALLAEISKGLECAPNS
jgi:HK97 family phage portal protein